MCKIGGKLLLFMHRNTGFPLMALILP